MSLSRNDLLTQMTARFADVGTQAVSMADFRWWFEQSLNYQDRDGTFDLTNTMASFTAVVDQNTDWNTLSTSGIRPCAATSAWTTAKNAPVGQPLNGTLMVLGAPNRVVQVYFPHDRAAAVSRTRLGASTWSSWRNASGRYPFPLNVLNNNTWIRLGTYFGGALGEACEIRIRTNQNFFDGTQQYFINCVIQIRNGNGNPSMKNAGALFYNAGGGSVSKIKAVRIVPTGGNMLDKNWLVYVQMDAYAGNSFYEVSHSPECDWGHDGTILAGAPPEALFYSALEEFSVNSPVRFVQKVSATALPTYANDSAAGTGGLVTGDLYKTSTGEVRVKV
jgi:hypothetical protein